MFEKITPEEAGISSSKVVEFIEMLCNRKFPMHSVLMMKGDKLFAEYCLFALWSGVHYVPLGRFHTKHNNGY